MSKLRSRLEQGWGELAWSQKSLEQRLDVILGAWRYAMPTLLTLMSGLLMLLPLWITGPIVPNLALIGVIYWSTTRPDLLPPFVAFTVGFVIDLWLGGALGVQATLLYLTALLLRAQILVFLPRPFSFTWSISIGVIFFYQIQHFPL
jgi:rod shape-determining protein MreD